MCSHGVAGKSRTPVQKAGLPVSLPCALVVASHSSARERNPHPPLMAEHPTQVMAVNNEGRPVCIQLGVDVRRRFPAPQLGAMDDDRVDNQHVYSDDDEGPQRLRRNEH